MEIERCSQWAVHRNLRPDTGWTVAADRFECQGNSLDSKQFMGLPTNPRLLDEAFVALNEKKATSVHQFQSSARLLVSLLGYYFTFPDFLS